MSADERWTDEAVRLEWERWVHVPPDGVRVEDDPKRVWYLWRDPGPTSEAPNNWISVFTGESAWTLDEQTFVVALNFSRKRETWRCLVSAPPKYEYLPTSTARVRPTSPACAYARTRVV